MTPRDVSREGSPWRMQRIKRVPRCWCLEGGGMKSSSIWVEDRLQSGGGRGRGVLKGGQIMKGWRSFMLLGESLLTSISRLLSAPVGGVSIVVLIPLVPRNG